MKIEYTTFSEIGKRRANQDVCRVVEMTEHNRALIIVSDGVYKAMPPQILTARLQDDKPLAEVVDVIKFMCEKYSTYNYTGILAEIV